MATRMHMRIKRAPPIIPPRTLVGSPPLLAVAIGVVFMIELGVDVTLARTPSLAADVDVGGSRTALDIVVVMIVAGFEAVSSVVYASVNMRVAFVVA